MDVVEGVALQIPPACVTYVVGRVRVVSRFEPVVQDANVHLSTRKVVEVGQVAGTIVEDLVSVGEHDAPIKAKQTFRRGFIQGADKDAMRGFVLKETIQPVAAFGFGDPHVVAVDPQKAFPGQDANGQTESPCNVVPKPSQGCVGITQESKVAQNG